MSVQPSKIILDKINALYNSLAASQQPLSRLEKDLMLDLIRQLYDSFLDFSTTRIDLPAPPPPPQQAPIPTPMPTPVPVATPPVAPAPAPVVPAPEIPLPQGMDALFDFKKATELADKLGEQPVRDLTKALSINDRLLYMNELFGKDLEAMNESLKLLNKLESFESGRSFLITLAGQYQWLDEARIDTARDFVRLIKRRYA